MSWTVLMLAAALGAGPGATAGPGADSGTTEPRGRTAEAPTPGRQDKLHAVTGECMFFRTIHDWRALDPYNLIVWFDNRHTARHIELETACYSARFADSIAFTSRDNQLCAFGGDSVIVGDMRCPIGAIHKVDDDEVERLIGKFEAHYKKRKSAAKDSGGR